MLGLKEEGGKHGQDWFELAKGGAYEFNTAYMMHSFKKVSPYCILQRCTSNEQGE
jgi:hypothetical protein